MSYDKIIDEINLLMEICKSENKRYLNKYNKDQNGPFALYNREKCRELNERYIALGECRRIVEKYAKEE